MTREFANQFVVSYTVGTMQLVRRYLLLLLFAVHWDSLRLLRYSCLGECAAWLPTSPGGDDLGFGGQMSRVEGRLNLEFTNALMNDEWIRRAFQFAIAPHAASLVLTPRWSCL